MELTQIREEIDQVDRQLLELFEKRLALSEEVAKSKIKTRKPVRDLEREQEKLACMEQMVKSSFARHGVREFFGQLMAISRKLQYQLLAKENHSERLPFEEKESLPIEGARVVFQGVEGAYSHQAALQYFGERAELFCVPAWEDAMNALCAGRADYGVIPIENSSAGAVGDVYDLLMKYDNYIVGETYLKVEHALLGLPEAELSDIKKVCSHPQGLLQCNKFLSEHKDWEKKSCSNTAASAKKVKEDQDKTQAAIASEMAGRLYGLKVLKKPINHDYSNMTRFVILTNRKIFVSGASHISICFESPHESGALYNLLSHFIYNDLNLTKIESRPIPGATWEYRFFLDFEGNLKETGVKNALMGISEEALSLKILGNY